MKPAVETPRAAKVQSATVDAVRRPTPRKPHLGLNRNPDRHSGTTSTRAWAATPAVALPASTQTIGEVQLATAAWCGYVSRKYAIPAMATRFATTGAHMYAAKWLRALST